MTTANPGAQADPASASPSLPILKERPPSFPLPGMPGRVTGTDQALHPEQPCSRRICARCGRGQPHPPLLAAYDTGKSAWTEAREPMCVARWPSRNRHHAPGELCGAVAKHRIAGIDLCPSHFYILERWRFADTRAEEIQRESQSLREAARELRAAERDYAGAVRDDEIYWERVYAARSVVYYVRRISDGMIKIGTSKSFRGRLNFHRGAHGPLQILLVCAGSFEEEHDAHRKFRAYQIGRTEWFHPARPVVEWIYKARQSERYAGVQPKDVLPLEDLRKLARYAPRRKDLCWENGVLQWPPDGLAA